MADMNSNNGGDNLENTPASASDDAHAAIELRSKLEQLNAAQLRAQNIAKVRAATEAKLIEVEASISQDALAIVMYRKKIEKDLHASSPQVIEQEKLAVDAALKRQQMAEAARAEAERRTAMEIELHQMEAAKAAHERELQSQIAHRIELVQQAATAAQERIAAEQAAMQAEQDKLHAERAALASASALVETAQAARSEAERRTWLETQLHEQEAANALHERELQNQIGQRIELAQQAAAAARERVAAEQVAMQAEQEKLQAEQAALASANALIEREQAARAEVERRAGMEAQLQQLENANVAQERELENQIAHRIELAQQAAAAAQERVAAEQAAVQAEQDKLQAEQTALAGANALVAMEQAALAEAQRRAKLEVQMQAQEAAKVARERELQALVAQRIALAQQVASAAQESAAAELVVIRAEQDKLQTIQDARAAKNSQLEAELPPLEIYDVAEHELTVLPTSMSLLHGMEKPPARKHALLAYSGWFAAAVMLGAMLFASRFSTPVNATQANGLNNSAKTISQSAVVAGNVVVHADAGQFDLKESLKLSGELHLPPAR